MQGLTYGFSAQVKITFLSNCNYSSATVYGLVELMVATFSGLGGNTAGASVIVYSGGFSMECSSYTIGLR